MLILKLLFDLIYMCCINKILLYFCYGNKTILLNIIQITLNEILKFIFCWSVEG